MTSELIEGASDGAVKKSRPDWSNADHADATVEARHGLSHVEGGYDWSPTDGDKVGHSHGIVRGC